MNLYLSGQWLPRPKWSKQIVKLREVAGKLAKSVGAPAIKGNHNQTNQTT